MKKFLYYLQTEDDKSYTLVDGEVVIADGDVPLTFTPDGWQDIAIAWERDMKTVGLVRTFSVPLGFVLDAATILRHLFYGDSIERKVYLLIKRLNTVVDIPGKTFQHQYNNYYRGELDLSTLTDSEHKVTVS